MDDIKEFGVARLDVYKKEIDRLNALAELGNGSYKDESYILCCVYIDRFSNLYNLPNINSGQKKFCELLTQYGENDLFKQITFRQLLRNFKNSKKNTTLEVNIANKIITYFDSLGCNLDDEMYCKTEPPLPEYIKTYNSVEFLSFCKLQLKLDTAEIDVMEEGKWKGSVASICYEFVRCPTIHEYTAGRLNIGDHKVDFNTLYSALENIYKHIRKLYEDEGKYFNFEVGGHMFSFQK